MAEEFSVVIVCKNEVNILPRVLASVLPLTDDIVVYDNGSTDGTIEAVEQFPVRLIKGEWLGYGRTKKKAVEEAKYDWILSLDADEVVDNELQNAIKTLSFQDNQVYNLKFKNFLGTKYLKWGEWGRDKHIRLFNRKAVQWNEADIHEELMIPRGFKVVTLKGYICHYTMKDIAEFSHKVVRYALLNAEKYYNNGKRASWLKLYISPGFTFTKYYLLQLGFLDGWQGFTAAYMTAYYTFLKYARLKELEETSNS